MKDVNNNVVVESVIANVGPRAISSSHDLGSLTNHSQRPPNVRSTVLLGVTVERRSQFKRLWFEVSDDDKEKRRFFDVYAESELFALLPIDWIEVLELVKENFRQNGFVRTVR